MVKSGTSRFPKQTLKKLTEGLPPDEQGGQGEVSEQVLKEWSSSRAPRCSPQARWSRASPGRPSPAGFRVPLGTLVLDKTFTFQGTDPKNPDLVQFTMEGRVKLEPRAQRHGQDPVAGRQGERHLRQAKRPHGRTRVELRRWRWHRRAGSRDRPDDRNDLGHDPHAVT